MCQLAGLSPGRSERRNVGCLGKQRCHLRSWWSCPAAGRRGCGSAQPPGAGTLMLIHGVSGTAEMNWGKVLGPLGRHFRVVAADLRGHGDGIPLRARFRLEDCADDVAALADVLHIPAGSLPWAIAPWAAWWPSCCTGGIRRSCRAWCCAPPPASVRGSPGGADRLRSRGTGDGRRPPVEPDAAPAEGRLLRRWRCSARMDDPATASWCPRPAERKPPWPPPSRPCKPSTGSRRTAGSARSMCRPPWSSRPATPSCPRTASSNWPWAIPGATVRCVDADHGACIKRAAGLRPGPAPGLPVGAAGPRRTAAHASASGCAQRAC